MPTYDVFLVNVEKDKNPFVEHLPPRTVIRGIAAHSKKEVRELFRGAKKKHPKKFKDLVINEIRRIS